MAERTTFDEIKTISTKEDICLLLGEMGVTKGMVVFVQANATELGHVVGGAQTIIAAFMESVGYDGTVIMPTFSPQLADPSCVKQSIERDQWNRIREFSLPFDRKLTSINTSDEIVCQFLKNEGVVRSYHPLYSFAAWGKYAKLICDKHPLHFGLNQDSPLGKIVEFNGYVVMLGGEYKDCVMFQLAHYQNTHIPIKVVSAPIEINKKRMWKDMLDVDYTTESFDDVGEAMEDRCIVKTSLLGNGICRFFSAREAKNLATAYFNIHND